MSRGNNNKEIIAGGALIALWLFLSSKPKLELGSLRPGTDLTPEGGQYPSTQWKGKSRYIQFLDRDYILANHGWSNIYDMHRDIMPLVQGKVKVVDVPSMDPTPDKYLTKGSEYYGEILAYHPTYFSKSLGFLKYRHGKTGDVRYIQYKSDGRKRQYSIVV